jgi:hypothetical protein
MLKPFLLVGVGGSGGKTLRALREMLSMRLEQEGWKEGWPKAWQMLHVDSPTIQDGASFPYPFLDDECYFSLVSSGGTYQAVYDSISQGGRLPREVHADVLKPLPSPNEVNIPVQLGAGQFRAVGRALALSRMSGIQTAAKQAINNMSDAVALGQLQRIGTELFGANAQGGTPEPALILVSSLAGGSGAGAYLDVIEAVKSAEAGKSWPLNSFGIVYAPDVFDNIGGKSGVAPNALAAMAEGMAGQWIAGTDALPSLNKETIELYASQGIQPAINNAQYVLGPKFSFLIGRQNGNVSFPTADDVFASVASSLMTWMIDDEVSDTIGAYAVANFMAQAPMIPDESRLKVSGAQAPPFSSIGFGRVTLGRDRFTKYSAEVLARTVVHRMLNQHTSEDPNLSQKNEQEWVATKATNAWIGFLEDSGLNERGEQDDVITFLRPKNRDDSYARLISEVRTPASQGLDKSGGLGASTWQDRIIHFFNQVQPQFLQQERDARNLLVRDWVGVIVPQLLTVTARSCVQNGLPVAAELLTRLEVEVQGAIEDLSRESQQFRQYAYDVNSYVEQQFATVASQDSIRPDHQSVSGAIEQVKNAFGWQAEAELREVAASLLNDFNSNVIKPLRGEVAGSWGALSSTVKNQNMPDGRENAYTTWPSMDGEVPKRFNPGENERLLIAPSQYPSEFKELVKRTVTESKADDPVVEVVTQVALGEHVLEMSSEPDPWSLIEVSQTWIPLERAGRKDQSMSNQPLKVSMSVNPEDYASRARHWLRRPDVAFSRYIDEDLASYLTDESIDRGALMQRQSKFQEEFTAAVAASDPLVDVDATLLMNIHGKALGEKDSVVSTIPFSLAHPVGEIIKNVLSTYKVWDPNNSPKWFKDTTAKVRSIDIFSMQRHPYEPIVFSSIMQPIAKQWAANSNNPDTRDTFWKWRRARSLSESIPAARSVVESMIRGWYVAKVLGQLDNDLTDAVRGPKLSVYGGPQNGTVTFPHPLLDRDLAKQFDFLGIVLQSLTIALAQCNGTQTLAPLYPYHRLIDLGGTPASVCGDLNNWIQSGTKTPNGPEPSAERAGTAEGSVSERRTAVSDYIEREKAAFKRDMEVDEYGNIRDYPVTWEIREIVNRELDHILSGVSKVREDSKGV